MHAHQLGQMQILEVKGQRRPDRRNGKDDYQRHDNEQQTDQQYQSDDGCDAHKDAYEYGDDYGEERAQTTATMLCRLFVLDHYIGQILRRHFFTFHLQHLLGRISHGDGNGQHEVEDDKGQIDVEEESIVKPYSKQGEQEVGG